MPVGKVPVDRTNPSPPATTGMSVLRAGGIQVRLSYSIIFASLALALVALGASTWPGNADLPRAIGVGVLFWLSGWVVQSIVYLSTSRLLGSRAEPLCLGVLGVETGPRIWPASRAMCVAVTTLVSVILLGSGYQMFGGGFHLPHIVRPGQSPWSAPSLGLTEHDTLWKSGAWLCWLQAIFQLYPLPRTLGRQLVGAFVGLATRRSEFWFQAKVYRHCLGILALLTMVLTVASALGALTFFGVPWIVLFVLSIMLWTSSRSGDVEQTLYGYRMPLNAGAEGTSRGRLGWSLLHAWSWTRLWYQRWSQDRRLQRVRRNEVGEAVDAGRLDEILSRLQRDGIDALSGEDRLVLNRVSERLRRRRQHESQGQDPPLD